MYPTSTKNEPPAVPTTAKEGGDGHGSRSEVPDRTRTERTGAKQMLASFGASALLLGTAAALVWDGLSRVDAQNAAGYAESAGGVLVGFAGMVFGRVGLSYAQDSCCPRSEEPSRV